VKKIIAATFVAASLALLPACGGSAVKTANAQEKAAFAREEAEFRARQARAHQEETQEATTEANERRAEEQSKRRAEEQSQRRKRQQRQRAEQGQSRRNEQTRREEQRRRESSSRGSPTTPSAPQSAPSKAERSDCFVTGSGNELCGAAARAFCDLKYEAYVYHDHASAQQCDDSFPGEHCTMVQKYNELVGRQEPAIKEDMENKGYEEATYHEPGC
jgi:hypothetical protein